MTEGCSTSNIGIVMKARVLAPAVDPRGPTVESAVSREDADAPERSCASASKPSLRSDPVQSETAGAL